MFRVSLKQKMITMYIRGFNQYLLFAKSVDVKIQIEFIIHLLISGPNAIQIREENKENEGLGVARRTMNNSKNAIAGVLEGMKQWWGTSFKPSSKSGGALCYQATKKWWGTGPQAPPIPTTMKSKMVFEENSFKWTQTTTSIKGGKFFITVYLKSPQKVHLSFRAVPLKKSWNQKILLSKVFMCLMSYKNFCQNPSNLFEILLSDYSRLSDCRRAMLIIF